ncbi:MAG: SpoIIE family protein phosphatase [Armatimonadetes bacterium]|nr:SpoIIE family protein phosphatase [Armatimonadota bacterium]
MMTDFTQPLTDPERLSALDDTDLLDSAPEPAFDRFTRLAGKLLHAPVVLVSLVTKNRQFFKSSVGLPHPVASVRETPLSHSFCQHVVQSGQPLIVADAREDPQLCENLAVADLNVRAYAGIPLTTADGHTLGSFCAIDMQPRAWTPEEVATLETLADAVLTEIELRVAATRAERQAQEAERERREKAALLESTAEGIYGMDRDGRCTFINPAAARMLGYPPAEALGRDMHQLIHRHRPDGSAYPASDCPISRAARSGLACRVEDDVFWRRDGVALPVDYCSSPLMDDGVTLGAVVAFSDITERKRAEAAVRASWERDRRVAETLQRAILQDVVEDRFAGLSVAGCYQPAWQEARIGGDFFDAFALDGGKVAFVVGDASGKGLGAAVRTAEAKFALRAFLREGAAPDAALARLNNLLCAAQRLEARDEDAFIVLTLAVVDAATGQAIFSTAGAEPPLILRAHGGHDIVQAKGIPVGFLADQPYTPQALRLDRGDLVLLATDGITEARRGSEFLGYDGMAELAGRAAASSASLPEAARAIFDGAHAFAGGVLHDDACLLLIRRA